MAVFLTLTCVLVGMAIAGGDETLGPNLVRNAGFEEIQDGAPVGWYLPPPAYTLDDTLARTDRRSLRFEGRDPDLYLLCSQPLDLQPGAVYELGAWVRTQGIQGHDSGATVCLEWQDAGGDYLGGFYPSGLKGDTPEWTEVGGATGQVPAGAAQAHVLCYVRKGMTGTAWWDDVSVRRLHRTPIRAFLTKPPYRGWILAGEPGEIEVRVDFLWQELDGRPGQFDLEGLLTAVGASEPAARALVQGPSEGTATLRMSLPEGAAGAYGLEVRLSDHLTGQVVARQEGTVERRAGALPRCYVDAHNRLIVDGSPFFPLGMYWGQVQEEQLRIYADSPFNCLMPYSLPGREQLDLAHGLGLKVIYSIKDFYHGTQWHPGFITSEAEEEPAVRRYVRQFRDHPAVLAWYINDELPLSLLPRLDAHRRWVEEEDPDHPAWVVLFQVDDVASYMDSFDVIGTDPYPIPDKPVSMAGDWTRRTRAAVADARAIWMVPQVFNPAVYSQDPQARPPTFEEMRCMAWQCIAEGADGLVFYSWFDLWRDRAHPFDQQWAKVKRVAEEVGRMAPVLLSVEPVPELEVEGSEAVRWTARSAQGMLHLFVVNTGAVPAEATVRFPRRPQGIVGADGRALPVAQDGSLALRLLPLDVVICAATMGPPDSSEAHETTR